MHKSRQRRALSRHDGNWVASEGTCARGLPHAKSYPVEEQSDCDEGSRFTPKKTGGGVGRTPQDARDRKLVRSFFLSRLGLKLADAFGALSLSAPGRYTATPQAGDYHHARCGGLYCCSVPIFYWARR